MKDATQMGRFFVPSKLLDVCIVLFLKRLCIPNSSPTK